MKGGSPIAHKGRCREARERRPEGLLCIPVPFVRLGGLAHQIKEISKEIYRM
jgi:hypothetical protein